MSEPLGALCIVLHGHLPYVLNHGSAPHGEAWLYEAAAETYLPLLELIDDIARNSARPALTIGLTPVLLEQLAHERFKSGFVAYLRERAGRAENDRAAFERGNAPHFAQLAERWAAWYRQRLDHFERGGRALPAEFARHQADGSIQILTSAATHAYLPLLLRDQSIRAQLACGTLASHTHLGTAGPGLWLPECAYRPARERWVPPVLSGDAPPRPRPGLESFLAGAGLMHFVVDTHLVTAGEALGTVGEGGFRETNEMLLHWDAKRGWRSPLEPVGVCSDPRPPRCFAFARHPRVSEQVWSGTIGYPGSPEYLEFHRKNGEGGLRYHKVTGVSVPLGEKHPYRPEDVAGRVYENAQHFCGIVRDVLREHREATGRAGVCVAPFDAELFGHWWFEGPRFLRDVILTLHHDPSIDLMTAAEALERHPPDKVMRLPEGSWGENGDHRVWMNDQTRWMWEVEYRAEDRMLQLVGDLPWRERPAVREVIERAARELLLLQASDWPFIVHTGSALDYGIQRFSGHATRFTRAADIAAHVAAGAALTPLQQVQIAEMDAHDAIFPRIDLNWWTPGK